MRELIYGFRLLADGFHRIFHPLTTYDQHETAPLPRLDTLGPADEARIRAAMRDPRSRRP